MALNNFFKINLPYGIRRNDKGEWTAFNREYKPLGENDPSKYIEEEDIIYTDYGKLSDPFLMKVADSPTSVKMDENNIITMVFLYDDATNPINHGENDPELWNKYFQKLKWLSIAKAK